MNGQVVNILGFEVSLQLNCTAVAQQQPCVICEPIKVALFQTNFIQKNDSGLDLTNGCSFVTPGLHIEYHEVAVDRGNG